MTKRGTTAYRKNETRLVTRSTLFPSSSSVSSFTAASASSLKTSPAMCLNPTIGYLEIEPNSLQNQSQQDFASASCAQKHVLAGTMSARELRSLNDASN